MNTEVARLQAERQELQDLVVSLQRTIAELRTENAELFRDKQCLMARLFGRKTEKLDLRQLELSLGLQKTEAPESKPAPARRPAEQRPARRTRTRKPRLPEHLPTEEVFMDPEEVQKTPEAFEQIGQETTQELGYVRPQYFRRLFIRRKYVSKVDRTRPPLIAPLPPRLIPGGYAGPEVIADVVVQKFNDHIPLYRQEQILRSRFRIDLSRKTLCDWVERAAWWLKPVYNCIRDYLRHGTYLQIDETPIRFCQREGGGSGQGYVWTYHRPGAGVLYEWHTGRGSECLDSMLAEFSGTIQTDGYNAYASYARERDRQIAAGLLKQPIELAGCWAHARRKFHEALEESPGQASWVLRQIGHLYGVEAQLRKLHAGPVLRAARRSAQSTMIVLRLEKMLRRKLSAHRPTSQMGKAIRYTLSQWPHLLVYLNDGRLEIDNNLVENAIRPTALGKKNWLFIGAPDAGERAAIIYTILENCKRAGIDPYEYLCDVLTRLPLMTNQQIPELIPSTWAAARQKQWAA